MHRIIVFCMAGLLTTLGAVTDAVAVNIELSPQFFAPIKVAPPKVAASGQRIILTEFTALNPDCSSNGPVRIKIDVAPADGAIEVVSTQVFPNYPPDNVRNRCNSRRVPGQIVYYTSHAGFTGLDKVVFESFFPNGTGILSRVPIVVR